jgi:hypothetical protein
LNGEFPLQEQDDGELNLSTGSSISDSETEKKKVRSNSPNSPRIPPAFMVAGKLNSYSEVTLCNSDL